MKPVSYAAIAKWAVLGLFTLWTVLPIALVILNSFKRAKDIFATTTPTLIFSPTLINYVNAFYLKANFGLYYIEFPASLSG